MTAILRQRQPRVVDVIAEAMHEHLYGDNGTRDTLRECWEAAAFIALALRTTGHITHENGSDDTDGAA